jgi:hypothetical protein
MKAISIKQPWAWLIANGYMTVENKKWYTAHRGDILIHASKSQADLDRDIKHVREYFKIGIDPKQLLFGQVLAVAQLIECTKAPMTPIDMYWHERGKFAWVLRRVRQIEPFAVRGRLNLFEVPFSWEEYPDQIREPLPDAMFMLVHGEHVLTGNAIAIDVPAYMRRKINCNL